MKMSKKWKGKEGIVLIIALIIAIIVIKLWLAWIQFNRFLFWFDIVFLPLSIIVIIISIIVLYKIDEFDRDIWYVILAIALVVFLITILTINWSYNLGYSNEAIKTKAKLENTLEDYT